MKKILCLVFIGLVSLNSHAKKEMTKNDAIEEICGATSDYAKSVMDSRQNGVSVKESIENINRKMPQGPIQDYYKAIAYKAYSQTKWESKENKDNASVEFSNEIYLSCVEAFNKELQ